MVEHTTSEYTCIECGRRIPVGSKTFWGVDPFDGTYGRVCSLHCQEKSTQLFNTFYPNTLPREWAS